MRGKIWAIRVRWVDLVSSVIPDAILGAIGRETTPTIYLLQPGSEL
jgi:hypothetical protein